MVEVMEGTLRVKTGHMTEAEVRIEMIVEDLGGAEGKVVQKQIGLAPEIEVRREVSLLKRPGHFIREYQKKKSN